MLTHFNRHNNDNERVQMFIFVGNLIIHLNRATDLRPEAEPAPRVLLTININIHDVTLQVSIRDRALKTKQCCDVTDLRAINCYNSL